MLKGENPYKVKYQKMLKENQTILNVQIVLLVF